MVEYVYIFSVQMHLFSRIIGGLVRLADYRGDTVVGVSYTKISIDNKACEFSINDTNSKLIHKRLLPEPYYKLNYLKELTLKKEAR